MNGNFSRGRAYIQERREDLPEPNIFLVFLKKILSRIDWMQLIPMLTLMAIGVLFIYGTGQQVGGVHAEVFWRRQITYMSLGMGVWFLLMLIDYRWLRMLAVPAYVLSLILLVLVLFIGTARFGARRWLDVGGISIQPSEIAKISLILMISWILSFRNASINKLLWAGLIVVITVIPMILILKEPDLGTTLVILPILGAIAFAARLKWRYIIVLLVLTTAFMPVAYYMMHDYQKDRIRTFLDPDRDPTNRGWNQLQSEIAVGGGGVTGKGFMNGTHCTLGYLPQTVANSDFIFPVIAEETGFLGSLALLFLYAALIFSVLRTALIAPDAFGCYLCVGVAALLLVHCAVNIGMCIRIAPVTGLPLPLVSYGGTFMIATMTYLGIVQSVYAHRHKDSFMEI